MEYLDLSFGRRIRLKYVQYNESVLYVLVHRSSNLKWKNNSIFLSEYRFKDIQISNVMDHLKWLELNGQYVCNIYIYIYLFINNINIFIYINSQNQ